MRVGNFNLDNTHEVRGTMDDMGSYMDMMPKTIPIEDNEAAIKQILWQVTDQAFKTAQDKYNKVKANIAVKVEKEDKSPDFSKAKVEQYYEEALSKADMNINIPEWEGKVKKYSIDFLDEPAIYRRGNFHL